MDHVSAKSPIVQTFSKILWVDELGIEQLQPLTHFKF